MAQTARPKHAPSTKNGRSSTKAPSSRRMAARTISRAQRVMGKHVAGDANDLRGEVGQLVQDIENRLDRLNALTKRGASHAIDGVNDLAFGAVTGVTNRVRKGALGLSGDAAKIGNGAVNRIVREIEKRPLLTLAIAVGLGIAAGFARRND